MNARVGTSMLIAACLWSQVVRASDAGTDVPALIENALRCRHYEDAVRYRDVVLDGIDGLVQKGALIPTSPDHGTRLEARYVLPDRMELLGVKLKYLKLTNGLAVGPFVFTDAPFAEVKKALRRHVSNLQCEEVEGMVCIARAPIPELASKYPNEPPFLMAMITSGDWAGDKDAATAFGCTPWSEGAAR